MSELPTGTVTFLFTDIEGSTQLLKRLGPAYSGALAKHQEIVRAAAAAHHGREVDTQGDSFFIAFRRGKDAVAAAVAIQRDLAAHAWPEGGVIKVRIGLHTGEPQVGEDRYVGMGVNKAARIGAAGHGGQVLISRTTRDLVEDELPPGVTVRDLGDRRLKDIERPEHLFQLVIEGLQSDFGQLKTLDVELSAETAPAVRGRGADRRARRSNRHPRLRARRRRGRRRLGERQAELPRDHRSAVGQGHRLRRHGHSPRQPRRGFWVDLGGQWRRPDPVAYRPRDGVARAHVSVDRDADRARRAGPARSGSRTGCSARCRDSIRTSG